MIVKLVINSSLIQRYLFICYLDSKYEIHFISRKEYNMTR